jgi:hypothetical protein
MATAKRGKNRRVSKRRLSALPAGLLIPKDRPASDRRSGDRRLDDRRTK